MDFRIKEDLDAIGTARTDITDKNITRLIGKLVRGKAVRNWSDETERAHSAHSEGMKQAWALRQVNRLRPIVMCISRGPIRLRRV